MLIASPAERILYIFGRWRYSGLIRMVRAVLFFLPLMVLFVLTSHGQDIGRLNPEYFQLAHKAGIPGVYKMFQDTTGIIWFGSTSGIYRYDGSRIYEFDAGQKKLLGKTNYAFLQAKNGDVIIGSDDGICRYSILYDTVGLVVHINRVFHDRSRYYPLCFDDNGLLWFAVSGRGIGYYDGKNVTWVDNPPDIRTGSITKLNDAFFDNKTGNVYLSNYFGDHSAIFNTKTRTFLSDTLQGSVTYKILDGKLYTIRFDYISSLNLRTGEQKIFNLNNRKELINNFLYSKSVLSDHAWLWVSLRDGILPFNFRTGMFGKVFGHEGDTKCPLLRNISELFSDREGNIWICTETDGIKILHISQLKRFRHLSDFSSSNNIIMDIEPVNDSLILVCPLVDNPRLVNIFTNEHTPLFPRSTEGSNTFTATRISGHMILLARPNGPVYSFNTVDLQTRKTDLPVASTVKVIVTSPPQTMVIFTGGQLKLYSIEHDQFKLVKSLSLTFHSENILYNPFTDHIRYSDQLQCIVIDAGELTILRTQKPEFGAFMDCFWDKDRSYWLATRSGLVHYSAQNKPIESFNSGNGLNNDVVYAIQANHDSTLLYVSTNLGISLIDPATKQIRNFTMSDGLQESEHNGAASACDAKGNYYFGNIKGVTVFNETIGNSLNTKPFLIIQNINTHDATKSPRLNPNFIKQIDLYPENEILEINFSLLSTSEPDRLIYSYKIEGIDKNFYRSDAAFVIRIAKPKPGSYTIVLRGEIEGGSFVEKRIPLFVHAPWYLKWWFLIPAILLFHVFVFLMIRLIIKNRLRKKQQEMDNQRLLFEQKSQISRELHDNVGARLSMMLNTVDWIGKKPQLEIKDLDEIKENTKAVIQGLRDAIWVMDKSEITAEELFDKIKHYSNQIIRNYPVELSFTEVTHKPVVLNTTQALNLFRIVQESLNNALKYSNASQILLGLRYEGENGIVLEIRDNGSGFDPLHVTRGHGLKNIQARADDIKAMVRLQSVMNKGTTVTITLYIV